MQCLVGKKGTTTISWGLEWDEIKSLFKTGERICQKSALSSCEGQSWVAWGGGSGVRDVKGECK